jgi:hypothetical protein
VLELGRQLEVGAVIAISVAQLGSERSVVFEVWRTKDGAQLAKDATVLQAGAPLPASAVTALVKALASQFPAKAKPKPDAPLAEPVPAPVPTPLPAPPPPSKPQVIVDQPSQRPSPGHSHAPSFVTGGVAIAAAIASIAVGASALSARAQFTTTMTVNGQQVSPYSATQARALAQSANLQGGIAAGAAGVALAMGVVAVVLW